MLTIVRPLALVAALAPAFALGDAGWEKISSEDGVVTYQKREPSLDSVSLRGETVIAARLEHVFDVMKDNRIAHRWVPMVKERRTLADVSATERVELTHIGMPWPLADRYFVNVGRAEWLDGGQLRLSVKSVEDAARYFTGADMVLGVLHYSTFLLTPIDGGARTRIELEVNSDPKGMIPSWIVNAAQRSWPRKFFAGLTAQLRARGLIRDTIGAEGLAH